MSYRYFIYDLDGTVLDTSPGILACLRETETILKIPPLPHKTLLRFIGPPLAESFAEYYKADPKLCKRMVDTYRALYLKKGVTNAIVYDHMVDGLRFVREQGCKTAIATLKIERMARLSLDAFDLSRWFDHVSGQREGEKTSKCRSILECLEALGCQDRSEAVFFGDSRYDGVGAMEAGVDFVPLTYGVDLAEPGSLAGIPFVAKAEAPRDIYDFVTHNYQKTPCYID